MLMLPVIVSAQKESHSAGFSLLLIRCHSLILDA